MASYSIIKAMENIHKATVLLIQNMSKHKLTRQFPELPSQWAWGSGNAWVSWTWYRRPPQYKTWRRAWRTSLVRGTACVGRRRCGSRLVVDLVLWSETQAHSLLKYILHKILNCINTCTKSLETDVILNEDFAHKFIHLISYSFRIKIGITFIFRFYRRPIQIVVLFPIGLSSFLRSSAGHIGCRPEDIVRTTKDLQERTQLFEWDDGETWKYEFKYWS